jgi:lantibiotic biosynthesis protein
MLLPASISQTGRLEWRALLDGSAAAAARAAAEEIASALAAGDLDAASPSELCDRALLFAYLSREDESGEWEERAVTLLNGAVEGIGTSAGRHPALFGGLSGVGWTIQHVLNLLGSDPTAADADDPLQDVDRYVIRTLRHYPTGAPYDLISGLVGVGVYLLERRPHGHSHEGLSLILELLERSSERSWGGRTWRTPPEGLPEEQRAICPNGHYNLGVAHGVPGVVYLLAEMAAADLERNRALRLLDPVLDWLLARRRRPTAPTRFSSWFVPGAEPKDSRLGWCYGDFGIGGVLAHAAARLGRRDMALCSKDLLDRSLKRGSEAGGIFDAGLCHGALGLAHICNRLSQVHPDGDATYEQAAVSWYSHALGLRRPGVGIEGFFAWKPGDDPPFVADRSLLSGAVGSALALLGATSVTPPDWDRLLLVSGRPSA